MKLKLYKYKLEDEALIVLNQKFEIININELAQNYFGVKEQEKIDIFSVVEKKTGINDLKTLVEKTLETNMQIKIQTKDNKTLLLKSISLHEKSLISIFVFQKVTKILTH